LALESLGISLEEARDRAEEIAGRGQGAPAGHIPFTPPAKRVLERALREALQLGHTRSGRCSSGLPTGRGGFGPGARSSQDAQ